MAREREAEDLHQEEGLCGRGGSVIVQEDESQRVHGHFGASIGHSICSFRGWEDLCSFSEEGGKSIAFFFLL